jgi:hypothetical protein
MNELIHHADNGITNELKIAVVHRRYGNLIQTIHR